jgi:hypothetical protein
MHKETLGEVCTTGTLCSASATSRSTSTSCTKRKYIAPEPSEEHTPLPTVDVGAPVFEATQVRMPSMVFREPVKHDELFPQIEELVDVLPSEDEVLVEKKLEFRSTIDTSALEERKREVQKREQPATASEVFLSRFSLAPWTILLGVVLLGAVLAIVTSVSINLFTAEGEPVTEVVVPSFLKQKHKIRYW